MLRKIHYASFSHRAYLLTRLYRFYLRLVLTRGVVSTTDVPQLMIFMISILWQPC